MTALNLYTMIVNVANITKELETAGMRLEIGGDFVAYRRLRNAQADRAPLYPMFDVSSSYVDAGNAFWVCGFNDKDELVHTQAIRRLDMASETLGEHINSHRHKYITPNSTPDPDRTFYSQPPALDRITGQVCYHGEFWLKGGDGGHRSQGFTALLSRVVFELALKIWAPDYVFGFVPMPLAFKGIPVRYGYTHCEPGTWIGPDKQITAEEALVWMGRSDIVQFLDTQPMALSHERRIPDRRELMNKMSVVA
ncbi:hypothetical protein [Aestuariicoccus sp. MJ-SS9]|uniref:hypothetical protein n=1 Tax=Aestuariicoccus sp. MJ-SS9 TaxID=3079855 RepID=UPI0029099AE0|nr:hypothetical protein [Aestuariicoccus sp. MJ-SS9]MDU8910163.1 hypothetical protein [Aestuariicoccus sp. MJ-SS9]